MNAEDQPTLNSRDAKTITDNREGPPPHPLYPMVSALDAKVAQQDSEIEALRSELRLAVVGLAVGGCLAIGFLSAVLAGILVAMQTAG